MVDYTPVVQNHGEDMNAKIDKGRVRSYVANLKKYSKKAGKAAAGNVIGNVSGAMGLGALLNIPSIYSTHQHIKRLNQLRIHPAYDCSCGSCADILDFIVSQKEAKRIRKGVGSIPVVSWTETTRSAVHHFTKSNQGNHRKGMAHLLWSNAKNSNATVSNEDGVRLIDFAQGRGDCLKAKAIIAELFGSYQNLSSWEKAEALIFVQFGSTLIADKMQSV